MDPVDHGPPRSGYSLPDRWTSNVRRSRSSRARKSRASLPTPSSSVTRRWTGSSPSSATRRRGRHDHLLYRSEPAAMCHVRRAGRQGAVQPESLFVGCDRLWELPDDTMLTVIRIDACPSSAGSTASRGSRAGCTTGTGCCGSAIPTNDIGSTRSACR